MAYIENWDVASIDSDGNIVTTGDITAGNITSSGTIYGPFINGDTITGVFVGDLEISNISITATSGGAGITRTGIRTFALVTASSANHIVILPSTAIVGDEVILLCAATGCKFTAGTGKKINGSADAFAATLTAGVLVRCVNTSATTWIANSYAADGTEAKVANS